MYSRVVLIFIAICALGVDWEDAESKRKQELNDECYFLLSEGLD